MPLHLLGKKSWNVYNAASIARVRADEAAARAKEEADELRMQEEDAAARIALLRGEQRPALPPSPPAAAAVVPSHGSESVVDVERRESRKRKRRHGEDETDHAMRVARDDVSAGRVAKEMRLLEDKDRDRPLQDERGHLQLFPRPEEKEARREEAKSGERARREERAREREREKQGRFGDVVRDKGRGAWYATATEKGDEGGRRGEVLGMVESKDVWGREDVRRVQREAARISSNDPFAAMQAAQRQLKQSGHDREVWKQRQAREIAEMREQEKSTRRRGSEDSLEGFNLDSPPEQSRQRHSEHRESGERRRHHRHHDHDREHRRHRSRRHSPTRSRSRHD